MNSGNMEQAVLTDIFRNVLSINTMSRRLFHISHIIHIISFNAQIAAARAGESGKTLRVMAHEISALAPTVAGYIEEITTMVNDTARHSAGCMNTASRKEAFSHALGLVGRQQRESNVLDEGAQQSQAAVIHSFKKLLDLLKAIRPILLEVALQTKSAEVIGTLLRIEVARAEGERLDHQAFTALSEEMVSLCDQMKTITKKCQIVLDKAIQVAESENRVGSHA